MILAGPMRGPFDAGAIYHSGARHDCVDPARFPRSESPSAATWRRRLANGFRLRSPPGQRPPARSPGPAATNSGFASTIPSMCIALLNRQLVSQPVERRSMPRVEIRCPVHIKFAEKLLPATMRNISARGLQIEGDELPPCGTYSLGLRGRAQHRARRGGVANGQPRRHRSVRGAQLDVDHPVDRERGSEGQRLADADPVSQR